jgi:hypothetical protein
LREIFCLQQGKEEIPAPGIMEKYHGRQLNVYPGRIKVTSSFFLHTDFINIYDNGFEQGRQVDLLNMIIKIYHRLSSAFLNGNTKVNWRKNHLLNRASFVIK